MIRSGELSRKGELNPVSSESESNAESNGLWGQVDRVVGGYNTVIPSKKWENMKPVPTVTAQVIYISHVFGKLKIIVVSNGYDSRGTFLWSAPSGLEVVNGRTHGVYGDKPPTSEPQCWK